MITERDRAIWRAALTLANNVCVKRSDAYNADDEPMALVREAADCANAIAAWIEPSDDQLSEMFSEAGVDNTAHKECAAELAELKSRSCAGCKFSTPHRVNHQLFYCEHDELTVDSVRPNFYCNNWEAKT